MPRRTRARPPWATSPTTVSRAAAYPGATACVCVTWAARRPPSSVRSVWTTITARPACSGRATAVTTPPVMPRRNTLLELTLFDAANSNPFTNDSLPLLPPPLGLFDDSKQFQVFVRTAPGQDFISKIAANVVALVIPEPSALILLMSGLACLGGMAGWRKRR